MTKETKPRKYVIDEQLECQIKMSERDRATIELYNAIADNDIEAAQHAIKHGAHLNAGNPPCDTGGGSPLDSAVYWANTYNCSTKMIEFLKEAGATRFNPERAEFLENAKNCLGLIEHLRKK